jgi:hypothetical protein
MRKVKMCRAERYRRNKTKGRRKQHELFLEKQKVDGMFGVADIPVYRNSADKFGSRRQYGMGG